MVCGGALIAAQQISKKLEGGDAFGIGPAKSTLAPPQGKITERVFFDVSINGSKPPRRINIGLYGDDTPITTKNFSTLCDEKKYAKTVFHRVIPQFMLQGGDYTHHNGFGGKSIYGEKFDDENFKYKHKGGGGNLSMANAGPNTNGSQFFITTTETPWLDGKHCVFGVVEDEESYEVVKDIEKLGSRSGKPSKTITVVDCGRL